MAVAIEYLDFIKSWLYKFTPKQIIWSAADKISTKKFWSTPDKFLL